MLERGRIYHRVNELHETFGGQRYNGISTPAGSPVIMIFTGEEGEAFGYEDGWQADGTFFYTGEGQEGDQRFIKGNLAIRDHVVRGKDLLLFEKLAPTQYRFIDQFVTIGNHPARRPDKNGVERDVIVFELVPVEALAPDSSGQSSLLPEPDDLAALRSAAVASSTTETTTPSARLAWSRRRATAIARYARKRAEGRCEACDSQAPFVDAKGRPFLEVHHLRRLSDGGPDHPSWVAAVCPNCHRRAHHAIDGAEFNHSVTAKVQDREAGLGLA